MAAFQASLINSSTGLPDITLNGNCSPANTLSFTIVDHSNYVGNSSPSSALANFSNFIKITVTHLPSGTQYTMQSYPTITPSSTLFNIPAPSTGTNIFTLPLITGDGNYSIVLQSVPTFDNSQANYIPNVSEVFNPTDGLVYVCLKAGAGQRPDLSPSYWQVATTIFSQYTDIEWVGVTCSLNNCINDLISDAFCPDSTPCDDPCTNDAFMNVLKLMVIQYAIQILQNSNNLQQATTLFVAASQICAC